MTVENFSKLCSDKIYEVIRMCEDVVGDDENVDKLWNVAAKRMSRYGAAIRNQDGIKGLLDEVRHELNEFKNLVRIKNTNGLSKVFRFYDVLVCQYVYLSSMSDYIENDGKSRGSALYSDKSGNLPYKSLPEIFRFSLDNGKHSKLIQEVAYKNGKCSFKWREVRKIPHRDDFFENVWKKYRRNKNVY